MSSDVAPYFFLSYVHTPQQSWVERLFVDLSNEVYERTTTGQPVGFMDAPQIMLGHNWRSTIDRALATCRVFVPLYSPRFFTSTECGVEWNAFEQRILAHRARNRGDPKPIVPALWAPVEIRHLPEVARRIQITHSAFGSEYAKEGFYTLIKNARYHDAYTSAVDALATHIIRAAEENPLAPLPAGMQTPRLNAFDLPDRQASGASRVTVVVAAPTAERLPAGCSAAFYGKTSLEWNPFQPETVQPIAECAADVAAFHAYEPVVVPFEEGFESLRRRDPQAGIGLLVVDAWCSRDEYLAAQLRELDRLDMDWMGVIVPWNRDGSDPLKSADLLAELRDVMPRHLGPARSSLTALAARVGSADQFRNRLPEVLASAFNACLDHVAAYPPGGIEDVPSRTSLERPQQRPGVGGGGTGGFDGHWT